MIIQDYKFGHLKIGDKVYKSDVIISKGRVDSWWRRSGHEVVLEDIKDVLTEGVKIVLFGSGASGLMKVSPNLANYLKKEGIEMIVEPTNIAVSIYNNLVKEGKEELICCLHLTC